MSNIQRRTQRFTYCTTPTLAFVALLLGSDPSQTSPLSKVAQPERADETEVRIAYGTLPLGFEPNVGQTDPDVKFLARGRSYALFLTAQEAVLTLSKPVEDGKARPLLPLRASTSADSPSRTSTSVRMKLVGASAAPRIVGEGELPGKSNYLIGNDPKRWRTEISRYGRVRYEEVYPGIDLVFYGNQGQLEYDFVVSAGADPRAITLAFSGAHDVRLAAGGELVLGVGGGEIRQHKPVIYQEVEGVRQKVAGGYRLEERNHVSFEVGAYDVSRPLVIDPVLVYATLLGGPLALDIGHGIAVDEEGYAYVTGETLSADFPTTPGAFQQSFVGGGFFGAGDAFVTKLNRSGTEVIYSTYLGGSFDDLGLGIALDKHGHAYVTGRTYSADFPTTVNAFQSFFGSGGFFGNGDAFVTKLNRSGTDVVYSTYLGGSFDDIGFDIAVDKRGHAYVTGATLSACTGEPLPADFPTTPGAFQPVFAGGADAFVTKLNLRGTALIFSTYLGGADTSRVDTGHGIAVDEEGHAYVMGQTSSVDFPTTPGAFQQSLLGNADDAFVTKLNRSGTALVYSTYLGGSSSFEEGHDIAVDKEGQAHVTGLTFSGDFPITSGAFQQSYFGDGDAFVTKINRSGTALVYSTYLGGTATDAGFGIAVDEDGCAYVTGWTTGSDFPTTPSAFQPAHAQIGAAFIAKIGHDDHDDNRGKHLSGVDARARDADHLARSQCPGR
jgi:Beta-propeller repeat